MALSPPPGLSFLVRGADWCHTSTSIITTAVLPPVVQFDMVAQSFRIVTVLVPREWGFFVAKKKGEPMREKESNIALKGNGADTMCSVMQQRQVGTEVF
jgi:hypothetical protein